MKKTNKHFISKIDQQLAKFDRVYQPSKAQLSEAKKYKALHKLRDQQSAVNDDMGDIWG